MLNWFYLLLAAICEILWPLGLKIIGRPGCRLTGMALLLTGLVASSIFLYLAQRTIPIGTAYAIWTGLGASGTFILGVLLFGDAFSMTKGLAIILIIAGVALLKLG